MHREKSLKCRSRVEHYLYIVIQSEDHFMASDWIKVSYQSLVTDSAAARTLDLENLHKNL